MLRRHFFLISALVVLVGLSLAAGLRLVVGHGGAPGGDTAAAQAPRPGGGPGGGRGGVQVSAAVVQTRSFRDELELLGVAKGRRSVTLTAATTQLVQRVRFTDGQFVPKGAVLVELKATEQRADLAQTQAHLVEARRAYERYRELAVRGFASKAALDQYEAAYRSAQADVAAAQAREADRLIRAPFAGVVGLSDVSPGSLINPGAPIVTLDDLSSVRADFQAPERYLTQLRGGMPIVASADAYPGESFTGRIVGLDTRVDERTRAITARAEFPNPNARLKGGMMLRIAIARGARQSLSAPEAAVAVQGDTAFVYVLHMQDGRASTEQRPVVTGLRQDGFVEITDGLQSGDRIVADGLNRVQPGQPVRILGQGRPAGAVRPPA